MPSRSSVYKAKMTAADPFDALVPGPPLPARGLTGGIVVGVMFMEDERGLDGRPLHDLPADVLREIGDYFKRYTRVT